MHVDYLSNTCADPESFFFVRGGPILAKKKIFSYQFSLEHDEERDDPHTTISGPMRPASETPSRQQ